MGPDGELLLFAAIGHFDLHRWRTSSGVPVLDAVDAGITGPLRERIDRSLGRQGEMLRHLVRWFGPYPFDVVGAVVDDSDLGFALENQTRPIYPPDIWDVPQLPTLGDQTIVHELPHQWYGDSVAIERWRDIWLISPLFRAWLFTPERPALPGASTDAPATAARPDPDLRRLVDRWRRGIDLRLGGGSSR